MSWPRRDSRFQVSDWDRDARPLLEEHRRRRRNKSIDHWMGNHSRDYSLIPVEEYWPPRRKGSRLSDSLLEPRRREYRPPHHHYAPPIVLPPLPTKPNLKRKKSKNSKNLYFTRPHDGTPHHRHGFLGRLTDALTNSGPDVFVTSTVPSSGRSLMRDRPQRWQWSNHGLSPTEILTKIVEPGFEWRDLQPVRDVLPWARRGQGEGYDWQTRGYRPMGHGGAVWTDAVWRGRARRRSWPVRVRDEGYRRWERMG